MRAKATVADTDSVLGAEPGCNQCVRNIRDGEGGKRKGRHARVGTEEPYPLELGQALAKLNGELLVVLGDGLPTDLAELFDR